MNKTTLKKIAFIAGVSILARAVVNRVPRLKQVVDGAA